MGHALRQRPPGTVIMSPDPSDQRDGDTTSYDNACNYSIHVIERFNEEHPDVAPLVQHMRWVIPSVHIHNHKEDCEYLYGSAYMTAVGHFHGETAEHYWPHANKVGAHVQHMNNGHRQDTLNDHHGDWNWKKVQKMSTLFRSSFLITISCLGRLTQRICSNFSLQWSDGCQGPVYRQAQSFSRVNP